MKPVTRRRPHGFTLPEVLIATAVAAVLAGVALPSYQGQVHQARRADGLAALMRIESAQASYHAHHGLYSADLKALGLASAGSTDGHYRLTIASVTPEGYTAEASAAADGAQRADTDCSTLSLTIEGLQTTRGPSPRCWLR
jgi:type IV pilus assembly protein PilE